MNNEIEERLAEIRALANHVEGQLYFIKRNFLDLRVPLSFGGEGNSDVDGYMVSAAEWAFNEEYGGNCRHILIFTANGILVALEKDHPHGNIFQFNCWPAQAMEKFGLESPLFNINAIKTALEEALQRRKHGLEIQATNVQKLIDGLMIEAPAQA